MEREVIVLPVVRRDPPPYDPKLAPAERGPNVVDLNSWIYMRMRRLVERREMESLLGQGETG